MEKSNLQTALNFIYAAKVNFLSAEKYAKQVLIDVLGPVGEHGVTIANIGDDKLENRIPLAEVNFDEMRPIALIRYWKGELEVFLTDFEDGKVTADGKWVHYDDVIIDTWYILDIVECNLEWADGYDDEN